jgi:50S ribosomal subunit-associated GTPase HflX
MGNTHLAESSSVQSVDRALTILEILAQRGESGVTEIAAD